MLPFAQLPGLRLRAIVGCTVRVLEYTVDVDPCACVAVIESGYLLRVPPPRFASTRAKRTSSCGKRMRCGQLLTCDCVVRRLRFASLAPPMRSSG